MDDQTRQVARKWTLALPTVSAFVGSLVRDRNAKEDILQETAMAVIDSFENYDPRKPFLPWAIGIARNQVRLYSRQRLRSHLVFDSESIDVLAQSFSSESTTTNKKLEYLGDCLSELDFQSRSLCQLRYEQNLSPAEIGEQTGRSPNTVSKALQRIRERLRDCIEGKWLSVEGHP